jgi:hypothetical protein
MLSMVAGFAILILYGLRAKEHYASDKDEVDNICKDKNMDCSAVNTQLTRN